MIGALASLVGVTGVLLALPMAPAFLELYVRRDTGPVPVKNRTEKVADFAQDFRELLQDRSGAAQQIPVYGTAMVLDKDSFLDEGVFFADPIYAKGRLTGGGNNVFSAIFCEKDVDLGKNAKVLSWVHAQGVVIVPPASTVYGRLSAGEQVELGSRCSFERVHAPIVTVVGGAEAERYESETGECCSKIHLVLRHGSEAAPAEAEAPVWNPAPHSILERVTDRLLAEEDFVLQAATDFRKNVVASRRVHLGEGSHAIGNLKSKSDMVLEQNVHVEGCLVSEADLRIGPGCLVMGPVLSDGDLIIESGTQIGTLDHPTTVRAPRIHIAPGVTLHGSLWAREFGRVTG